MGIISVLRGGMIACVVTFFGSVACGQQVAIRTDLIPSSPNASSISKAGDMPVNFSTGLPQLSLPLFTASGHELSLPVSLNYHYDGFKPAQLAGWTGLGWSLDAGGVITRHIRDKVDGSMGAGNYDGTTVQSQLYTPSQSFLYYSAVNYDTQPDVYSYSFPGYSGKFIVHKGKVHLFPYQPLKIIVGPTSFTIINPEGIQYEFAETETTTPKGSGDPYTVPTYTSAWYLSRITNASGTEFITLSYSSEGTLTNAGALTQTYKKDLSLLYDTPPPAPTMAFPTYVTQKRLIGIVSEQFNIAFSGGSVRQDLNQSAGATAYNLGMIQVTDKAGTLIKKYKFNYQYSGTGFSNEKYLQLRSLQECPLSSSNDTLTHSFDYNSIAGNINQASGFVDHFNYYTNNGDFSAMLIPNLYHTSGVNRTPNIFGSSQGALTRITYPTKGYTAFEYEGNLTFTAREYQKDWLNVSASVTRPPGGTATYYGSAFDPIVINEAQTIEVLVTRTPYSPFGDGIARNVERDFVIRNSGGDVFWGSIAYEADNPGLIFSTFLNPGTYYLDVGADYREAYISASVNYYKRSNRPVLGEPGGGIRLKSLTTSAGSGTATYTRYQYTDGDGFSSGISSGNGYVIRPWRETTAGPGSVVDKDYQLISSYVGENYGLDLPHHYHTVMEQKVAGTDTLFTRYHYQEPQASFMMPVLRQVTEYQKNGSGVLLPQHVKQWEYITLGDTVFNALKPYQTMEVTILPGGSYGGPLYEFAYDGYQLQSGWQRLRSTRQVSYHGSDSLVVETRNSYDSKRNLTHTRTSQSDGSYTITRTKYPQSYVSGYSAMINNHVLSLPIERQQWHKRGTDSVLVSAQVNLYNHTLFKPTQQYFLELRGLTALNNESRTGNLYNYTMSDSRYTQRLAFSYDAAGRLTSQLPSQGVPTSYQWGYGAILALGQTNLGQKNFPVAEIKNAAPGEFMFENFEEHGSATTGAAHTGNKFYTGSYPVSWSIPNARSYVITFFYRVSGAWHYKQLPYTGAVTLSYGDAIDDIAILPSDALLSSYTYQSGFGQTGAIDVRGNTNTFTYDHFGRLRLIKDQFGHIKTAYDYHYRP